MASGMPSGLIQSNSNSKLVSTRNYPNCTTFAPLTVQLSQYSTGFGCGRLLYDFCQRCCGTSAPKPSFVTAIGSSQPVQQLFRISELYLTANYCRTTFIPFRCSFRTCILGINNCNNYIILLINYLFDYNYYHFYSRYEDIEYF